MIQKFLSALIWVYWFFCFLFFLIVVTLLFTFTFPFDKHRTIPNKALKGLAWIILKSIPTWSFTIVGADTSKIKKPTLIVSNHQSFLDLPLLYLLPWSMKWVAKKSLLRIPILGWLIAMTGHLMIDRKSLRSYKKLNALVEPVKQGIPAMVFPEGTRTRDGSVQSFKNGAFALAKKYDFNILPVVHTGGFEAMPASSWQFNFNICFQIAVLDPVDPADFENAKKLNEYVYQKVYEGWNRLESNDW